MGQLSLSLKQPNLYFLDHKTGDFLNESFIFFACMFIFIYFCSYNQKCKYKENL